MKSLLVLLVLCIACPALAETWKDAELREAKEQQIRLFQAQHPGQTYQDPEQCKKECKENLNICLSGCAADGNCAGACFRFNKKCISKCN